MDQSALTEAQQQQYYSSQQQQQEQQQQQDAHYHQQAAYAAYYAAYHHHQNQHLDPSQYHQQQYGASAYPHNNYHQYYYSGQDPSSYYQAVPAQPQTEGVGPAIPSQIQGHVYAAAAAPPQDQQIGLNPEAAAAALAQLSQLADTMDRAAAEAGRHLHGKGGPPQPGSRGRGRSSNRAGGRRGGISFRDGGGGRGNFIHQPSRQDGGEPSAFRGRGRGGRGLTGRSRGRKFHQSAPGTATVGEQSLVPGSAQQARRSVLPVAWCDICRVDCNSFEILEQHKSGKRHKKTVQRVDEIQKQQRLFDEMQAKGMPGVALQSTEADPAVQTKEVYQSSSVVGITPNAPGLSAQVGNATMVSTAHEITPSAVFSAIQVDGTNSAIGAASENEQTAELTLKQDFEIAAQKEQTNVTKEEMVTEASPSDAPLAAGSLTEEQQGHPKSGVYNRFDGRRGGLKRQMTRFGRGGKRLKTFDRDSVRPRNNPRVCTLCNITCDTLAVFECHLSGKKHMSKIKRFQGQRSVYGPITVYIPPDQPSTYPTQGPDPLYYGLKYNEMFQQESVVAKEDKEGLSLDNTVTQDTVALDSGIEDPSLAPLVFSFETNSEADVPFTTGEYVIPLPEFGDRLGDDVSLPGLGAEVEELGPNTEELAKLST